MPRVAVTGLGLVCGLGRTVEQAWPRLIAGEHAIAPITRFDARAYAAGLAAEVHDSAGVAGRGGDPVRNGLHMSGDDGSWRRGTRLFVETAAEAWRDAGLAAGEAPTRAGVFAGASVNYLHMRDLRDLWVCRDHDGLRVDLRRAIDAGIARASSFGRRQGETMAAAVADTLRLDGPRLTVDTACASGAHAVADAFRSVARGEVPIALAGGGAALLTPLTLLAFSRIGALSTNPDPNTASRPFDKRRDGFVIGEGAAVVVLESLRSARERGARIYATIEGAASTVNASSLTDPSPAGEIEAATISLALRDARVQPDAIDYVAAHGTSTPRNDVTETQALHRALGVSARHAAVSSHKGQLGHTLAAAGAINVVLAAKAIHSSLVPPTAHLAEPDPECDLDYVPHRGRPRELRAALAHAFAFGGQNAVLVLRRAE